MTPLNRPLRLRALARIFDTWYAVPGFAGRAVNSSNAAPGRATGARWADCVSTILRSIVVTASSWIIVDIASSCAEDSGCERGRHSSVV